MSTTANCPAEAQKEDENSSSSSPSACCRICLNSHFESDLSRLDRGAIVVSSGKAADLSDQSMACVLSGRCRCTGSVGHLHLGCLLLEVQFRQSAACSLCQTPYQGVSIRRTGVGVHRLLAYLAGHLLRCLATLALVLAVPLLTTVWFCNRIKFCSLQMEASAASERSSTSSSSSSSSSFGGSNESSSGYRVVVSSGRPGKGTSGGQAVSYTRQPIHPLLVLIFSYHADVLWINIVNLLLIQLILHNLEHYQQWKALNRPRVAIHLSL